MIKVEPIVSDEKFICDACGANSKETMITRISIIYMLTQFKIDWCCLCPKCLKDLKEKI